MSNLKSILSKEKELQVALVKALHALELEKGLQRVLAFGVLESLSNGSVTIETLVESLESIEDIVEGKKDAKEAKGSHDMTFALEVIASYFNGKGNGEDVFYVRDSWGVAYAVENDLVDSKKIEVRGGGLKKTLLNKLILDSGWHDIVTDDFSGSMSYLGEALGEAQEGREITALMSDEIGIATFIASEGKEGLFFKPMKKLYESPSLGTSESDLVGALSRYHITSGSKARRDSLSTSLCAYCLVRFYKRGLAKIVSGAKNPRIDTDFGVESTKEIMTFAKELDKTSFVSLLGDLSQQRLDFLNECLVSIGAFK